MFLIALIALLLIFPLFGIVIAWWPVNTTFLLHWQNAFSTVLPDYWTNTAMLIVGVFFGVVVTGMITAVTVSLFEFRGRRFLTWALLLPMAMPAYVCAYAYTDFLQNGRGLLPDIRSLDGAIFLFIVTLYPYPYLLTRTALQTRAPHLMEAAHLLGASLFERIMRIALPLARPALTAGAVLALMETLADYGVCAYFGLTTFSTGIYKAWVILDDHTAAAQLACVLLAFVAMVLWLEHYWQRRLHFLHHDIIRKEGIAASGHPLRGIFVIVAWLVCVVPIVLGFILPALILLRLLWQEAVFEGHAWMHPEYLRWVWNSFRFGLIAASLSVVLAILLNAARRFYLLSHPLSHYMKTKLLMGVIRMTHTGYAVPGVVIAVGILLPSALLQPFSLDIALGVLFTTTSFGILYAYLVRFSAVAMQSIEAGYMGLPRSMDEVALMLNATVRRIACKLHTPLLRRFIGVAFLMVFVDVIKELPATLLLRPFHADTLAVIVHHLARDERLGQAALPALTIVLVGLVPVWFIVRIGDREGPR